LYSYQLSAISYQLSAISYQSVESSEMIVNPSLGRVGELNADG